MIQVHSEIDLETTEALGYEHQGKKSQVWAKLRQKNGGLGKEVGDY